MVQSDQRPAESTAVVQTPMSEGSVVVVAPTTGTVTANARVDTTMVLLLVVLAAFGVVAMALYALQLALKRRKR